MEEGKRRHEREAGLEWRRSLRRYGLQDGELLQGLTLESGRLGLRGRIDQVVKTQGRAVVVEFKETTFDVTPSHRVQVAAYALLLEEALAVQVPAAVIVRVPTQEVTRIEITPRRRARVLEVTEEVRRVILSQEMPPPHPHRSRCLECEKWRFCGDVW
jgi:CRISPR-associated exonuclease Cas4